MPYLVVFGLEFKKTIFIFEINPLKFVYLQSFGKKTNMSKFGPKNASFGYFWPRIKKNASFGVTSTLG